MKRLRSVISPLLIVLAAPMTAVAAPSDPPRRHSTHQAAAVSAHHAFGPGRQTFSGAINTSKRGAVHRAYLSRMAANLQTPMRWTGSSSRCLPGHASRRAQAATLESINFIRALAQLAPVRFNERLSMKAQRAALMMTANERLDHAPPSTWKCWSAAGATAAAHSNLVLAWPRITAGGLVKSYMDDSGSSNTACGHRRWILYPPTRAMGSGSTTTANALWVIGPRRAASPSPAWVSWPSAGWFPSPLEPSGRWSLSAGRDGTDFSHARISVTDAQGQRLDHTVVSALDGYGANTLVWDVEGLSPTGSYTVSVRGITRRGASGSFGYRYQVRMFEPSTPRRGGGPEGSSLGSYVAGWIPRPLTESRYVG